MSNGGSPFQSSENLRQEDEDQEENRIIVAEETQQRGTQPETQEVPNEENTCTTPPPQQQQQQPLSSSKANQMIPIALLRKSSACSVMGNSSPTGGNNNGAAGIFHIITGANKVAPAAAVTVTDPQTVTTVDAAVLMLVPKKSDFVCVDIHPEQDQENNRKESENLLQQTGGGSPICSRSQPQLEEVKPTQSYDSYEEVCRICHDNPSKLELISPCLCKGSMSKVHRMCLERWLGESAKNSCEICGYEYNTVRKPKYTGCRSFCQWIRHPLSPSDTRNLFFDIACFFILTPLAAISSWLCVVGAQHYASGDDRRRKLSKSHSQYPHDSWSGSDFRVDPSNAAWTSVGLLSLTGTLLVAYSVWLFVAIKYHIQAWSDWQQRNFTVTIVPFEDGCMGRPPPPRGREQIHPVGDNNNNNNNNINHDDLILSALLWESANGSSHLLGSGLRGIPLDSISSSVLAALGGHRNRIDSVSASASSSVDIGFDNDTVAATATTAAVAHSERDSASAHASVSAPVNVAGVLYERK